MKSGIESVIGEDDLAGLEQLARESPNGAFVEVGVWRGGSAHRLEAIAKERGVAFFAYDTFEGMPYADTIDCHAVGYFGDTDFDTVRLALPDTTVVKGVFPDSAVPMPGVGFAHIDCDQYRSIIESAAYLTPLMVRGGIMLFDDAGVEHLPGASQAVEELFPGRIEYAHNHKWFVRF